jgi:hypothetical protein
MDLQALVDGMSARMMRERAETQMTLGKLISALEGMPKDALIQGIDNPHSYRGYYSDLAFETDHKPMEVGEALKMCKDAMGQVFEGYKGGDFVMGALTPVWIAEYGCCGLKIMGIDSNGTFITAEDE